MEERAEQQADRRVPAYSWYALGLLVIVYLLNFVDRQILSILANDIKADLGLDDAQLGFLYGTAFAIFYALFGIPLGRLADGWNRTRLLAAGLALWSLMTALSGLARNGATLAAARVGVGIGEATANPCAYSLIADWFPQRVRATALAIYSSGLFVGSGLSLLVGGLIVQSWNAAWPEGAPLGLAGWQAAFVAVGAPGLVLALWVLSLREPTRGAFEGGASQVDPHPWRNLADSLAQIVPPFTLIGAARRGARALTTNLAAAAALALAAWWLGELSGNLPQFAFVAVAWYAVFSWAAHLRATDPQAFEMTWRNPAFAGVVLAYAIVCYLGYTVSYWAAPYAERTFAFDKVELGWLIGAPAAARRLPGGDRRRLAGRPVAPAPSGRAADGHGDRPSRPDPHRRDRLFDGRSDRVPRLRVPRADGYLVSARCLGRRQPGARAPAHARHRRGHLPARDDPHRSRLRPLHRRLRFGGHRQPRDRGHRQPARYPARPRRSRARPAPLSRGARGPGRGAQVRVSTPQAIRPPALPAGSVR